jgi:hypothetical protein
MALHPEPSRGTTYARCVGLCSVKPTAAGRPGSGRSVRAILTTMADAARCGETQSHRQECWSWHDAPVPCPRVTRRRPSRPSSPTSRRRTARRAGSPNRRADPPPFNNGYGYWAVSKGAALLRCHAWVNRHHRSIAFTCIILTGPAVVSPTGQSLARLTG